MDNNQKRAFCLSFGYAYIEENEKGKDIISDKKVVLNDPKQAIFHGLRMFLAIASISMSCSEENRKAVSMQFEIAKQYQELYKLNG